MKLVEIINRCFDNLKDEAEKLEDGNTIALIDRIKRDVASLRPEYHNADLPIAEEDVEDEPVEDSAHKDTKSEDTKKPAKLDK